MNLGSKMAHFVARAGFLSAVIGVSLVATPVLAASLFSDGFESNNFTKWTQVDSGTTGMWRIDTARYTGKYSANVIGSTGATDDVLRKAFSTDTYSTPTVSFFYKASSLDYKSKAGGEFDRFFVEYSTNGTSWTLIKEVNGKMTSELDSSWRQVTAPVPTHAGFQLRFRAHLSDSGDRVWIDDVVISGAPMESTLPRCTDRQDNDADGYIDRDDSECDAFYSDLTIVKNGTGEGDVTSSPLGISCGIDCMERYLTSAVVTLSQAVTRGFTFAGWSGACSGLDECEVTMSTDKYVTATFNALPAVTVTVANDLPASGSIASTPAGIACGADCSEVLYQGEPVSLTATAHPGFRFDNWSGDCAGMLSNVCNLVADTTDLFATAHYVAIPQYTLTVANDPTGGGTIVSDPVGLISCGADCAETMNEYTKLTIQAIATLGFVFDNWSGDCSGTDVLCPLIMDADKSATAHYTALEPGICGNAIAEWDEQCDDGNSENFDGCSTFCTIPHMECSGTVSYPICRIVF